jgi:hypothetical protein
MVQLGGLRDTPSVPEQLKSVICAMPEKHKATAYSSMIIPLTMLGQIVTDPRTTLIQVAANQLPVVGQNDSLLHRMCAGRCIDAARCRKHVDPFVEDSDQDCLCTQEVWIIIPKSWPSAYGDTYTGAPVVAMCVLVLKPGLGSKTAAEAFFMSIVSGLNDLHS